MPNKLSFQNPAVRFFLFFALIAVSFFLGRAYSQEIGQIRAFLLTVPVAHLGVIYIILYVGVTTLVWFGTIDFFRVTGAVLFGPYLSSLLVWIAEIANASILFYLSRRMGREYIEQKFFFKEKDLSYGKEGGGFWKAFILRINPLVPFRFMDVGFGLSRIEFKKYFWAVVLGSPLRILGLQFMIAAVGEALWKDPRAAADYLVYNAPTFLFMMLGYVGVVITLTLIAVTVSVVKRKKGR